MSESYHRPTSIHGDASILVTSRQKLFEISQLLDIVSCPLNYDKSPFNNNLLVQLDPYPLWIALIKLSVDLKTALDRLINYGEVRR